MLITTGSSMFPTKWKTSPVWRTALTKLDNENWRIQTIYSACFAIHFPAKCDVPKSLSNTSFCLLSNTCLSPALIYFFLLRRKIGVIFIATIFTENRNSINNIYWIEFHSTVLNTNCLRAQISIFNFQVIHILAMAFISNARERERQCFFSSKFAKSD